MEDTLRITYWFLDPANHAEVVAIGSRLTKQPPERLGWVFTKQDYYHVPGMRPDLVALQRNVLADQGAQTINADTNMTHLRPDNFGRCSQAPESRRRFPVSGPRVLCSAGDSVERTTVPSRPLVEDSKGGKIGRNKEIPHLGAGRHGSGWPPQLPGAAVAAHEGLHGYAGLRGRVQDHDALGDDGARIVEVRVSRAVIRGAIAAEREGYDVFFMNHFQDVGLYDARAAVKIPVLGLGEATLLHACMMGRKLGLIAIHPAFHTDA